MSRKRNSETWWRRTTTILLGVLFETYRRRRRDVPIGRCGYLPLRRLGNVLLKRCFMRDLFETSWRCAYGTSLLRPFETSLRRSNKTSGRCTTDTSWWRSIETSLVVSFGTYLRRHWDVQRDVITTSPRSLNAGWAIHAEQN